MQSMHTYKSHLELVQVLVVSQVLRIHRTGFSDGEDLTASGRRFQSFGPLNYKLLFDSLVDSICLVDGGELHKILFKVRVKGQSG